MIEYKSQSVSLVIGVIQTALLQDKKGMSKRNVNNKHKMKKFIPRRY